MSRTGEVEPAAKQVANQVGKARPSVGVLDYGSGNLHSVCRALELAGATVTLSSDPRQLASLDRLVVPGVGAFSACVKQLASIGGDDLVAQWSADERALLAICVGHQVLFDYGVEHGQTASGIGLFAGVVERLHSKRLPHMGWNTLSSNEPGGDASMESTGVFRGIENSRFYFVHSYGVHELRPDGEQSLPDDAQVMWTDHDGDRFVAAVTWRQTTSTQFHPEKSGAAGATLLRNWIVS